MIELRNCSKVGDYNQYAAKALARVLKDHQWEYAVDMAKVSCIISW